MSDKSGIIGVLLGFIVAFLAEPIKNSILNLINIRLLRKAIYCELLSIYDRATYYLEQIDLIHFDINHIKTVSDIFELFIELDKKAFFHAKEQQLLLYYNLKEAIILNILFSEMDYRQNLEKKHDLPPDLEQKKRAIENYANFLKDTLEKFFRKKLFDKSLLLECSQGLYCEGHLSDVLSNLNPISHRSIYSEPLVTS